MNPKVNWFFEKPSQWQDAYIELRELMLASELEETLKWGCPCYTFEKNNIVLIHGFKDYCALLFMQGALLKDAKKVLVQQTENVQAARQLRFKSCDEVIKHRTMINRSLKEAMTLSKTGQKVVLKKTAAFTMPEEFQIVLNEMPALKIAFQGLTPGRQRGYLLYFSTPKQSKTRENRIEKHIEQILKGKGLND